MADLLRTSQNVSQKLVENGLQTVTLIFQNNSLQLFGNSSMIDAIIEDEQLLTSLEARFSKVDKSLKTFKTFPSFPRLFANPETKEFCRINLLREQVSTYLHCLGFGKGMKLFGSGDPPKGWPSESLDRKNFKGPKRSCNAEDCKILLKSILEAHNIEFLKYGPKKGDDDDTDDDEAMEKTMTT